MTAKEKQTEFIKSYLKPTLKQHGYQTSGLTWWKDRGDFFNVINLQNYSWNLSNSVHFRFNIGMALKATVRNEHKKKVTYHDLITHIDEGVFLPDRINRKFGNNLGYSIEVETILNEFISVLKIDFENYIIPGLGKFESLDDWLRFYERFPVLYDSLKRKIQANDLKI
ncbi:DUF4304 domain-containing protein [Fibrella arboris]|uniref:DUF4304 domain-containing protein n=1 Tax=Fibrella arboris TaxID=3242486 RepID=UPI00351F8361